MATVVFTLNGETKSVTTDPGRTVLEVLREDLDVTGAKYGCGEGACRSCVVLVDDKPLTSCQTPLSKIEGKSPGVQLRGGGQFALHPVQQAYIFEGAMQCGYCVPGMILTATALLNANPQPTRAQIVDFMDFSRFFVSPATS